MDFGIFHELGHVLDGFGHLSLYTGVDSEAVADTAGRYMENALGLPPPPFPVPDGYH